MQSFNHSSALICVLQLISSTAGAYLWMIPASIGQEIPGESPVAPESVTATMSHYPEHDAFILEGTSIDVTDLNVEAVHTESEMPQLANLQTDVLSTRATDLNLEGRSPQASLAPTLPDPTASGLMAQSFNPTDAATGGNAFTFRIGSRVPVPTVLQGAGRPRTVLPGSNRSGGLSGVVRLSQPIGSGEVAVEVEGGTTILAVDVSYNSDITPPRRGFGANFFNQRSYFPAFRGGDRNVDLPNGEEMWLHRLGGGVEYYLPFSAVASAAVGVSYQRVSVRDDRFTSDIDAIDEFGNELTVDGDGIDDLLTLNAGFIHDTRDDRLYPTTGSIIRFGVDQGFNLGSENNAFNRISGNYTQFIPFSLFGFDEGPRTLVLNLQAGGIIGDTPPYEGFNLGGINSVRGYDKGDIGTGSRFIQATAEYQFPMFSLNIRNEEIAVSGTLFVDYGSTLDSDDDVIGEPGVVRDKPGDGLGFGVGLRIRSPFGPLRLEYGFGDDGDSVFYFTTGSRF